jgi:hypothetical protein
MGKSPSPIPVQKVTIGALAGAITTLAVGLLRPYVDVPADVAGALTIVLTFIASYVTPPESQGGDLAGSAETTGAALANGCDSDAKPGCGRGGF